MSDTSKQTTSEDKQGSITVFVTSLGAVRDTANKCKKLLFYLESEGIKFTKIDLSLNPERREEMEKWSGKSTLPQIFVGNEFLGGVEEIEYLVENEKLLETLKEFGYHHEEKEDN